MSSNWGGGSNTIIGPCGACKFLRRKCVSGCVFAPYFQSDQGAAHFAAIHKVFGASNASKMLLSIPPQHRLDAVVSMCYEALARVRDPVYGCVAQIFALQQQVLNLQAEVACTQAKLATLRPPQQPYPSDQSLSGFPSMRCEDALQMQSWSPAELVDQGEVDDGDQEVELQSLARQLMSRHFSSSGFTFRPPTSSP
uniref:LOB domain-containing protein n=1 Tax=Kalanchoe fedtschenkoi TaxID=63787 RepID=A0A7N0TDC9_KALFE